MDIRGKHMAQKIPQRQEEEWAGSKTNVHTPRVDKALTPWADQMVAPHQGLLLGVHPHQLQNKAQLFSLTSKLFPGRPTAWQNDTVMKNTALSHHQQVFPAL